jgi:hypothetical protein
VRCATASGSPEHDVRSGVARAAKLGVDGRRRVWRALERLHGEIKRRTDVVGRSSNGRLLKQNDGWTIQRCCMRLGTLGSESENATARPASHGIMTTQPTVLPTLSSAMAS